MGGAGNAFSTETGDFFLAACVDFGAEIKLYWTGRKVEDSCIMVLPEQLHGNRKSSNGIQCFFSPFLEVYNKCNLYAVYLYKAYYLSSVHNIYTE